MPYHILGDARGDHREMLIVSVWDVYNYLKTSPWGPEDLKRHLPRPDKIGDDKIPYGRGNDASDRPNLTLREQFVYDTFRPSEGQKIDDGGKHWSGFEELWPGPRDQQIEQKNRLWFTLSEFTSAKELKKELFSVQRGRRVEICSIAILCACDTRATGVDHHEWSDQPEKIVFVPAGDPMRLLDKVNWESPREVRLYGMNCESVDPNEPSEAKMWIRRENLATMDFANTALGPPLRAALELHSRVWLDDMVSGETAADDSDYRRRKRPTAPANTTAMQPEVVPTVREIRYIGPRGQIRYLSK
jgi:hypothetical protein